VVEQCGELAGGGLVEREERRADGPVVSPARRQAVLTAAE
jgi:hypothetical protein